MLTGVASDEIRRLPPADRDGSRSHVSLPDPRVAVSVSDPANPGRYYEIRGRVTKTTTEGGAEHIEALAQRYLGTAYPWYGGRDQVRVILTISADKVRMMG
jgi:hypothetical protein